MSLQFFRDHLLRPLLALVLCVAAIAKLFSFSSFAGVMMPLVGLGGRAATEISAVVILLELTSGVLLIARPSIRAGAAAAFALFLGFALVLTSAVMRGLNIPCMCFGFLAPRIPLRLEALLDLLFCLGALACMRETQNSAYDGERGGARPRLALTCAILWGSLILIWPTGGDRAGASVQHADEFFPGATALRGDFPAVTLIADFDDFACQICLDDFLAFCDSLNVLTSRPIPRIRLVARRDPSRTIADQSRMLEGWAAGNGYRFPVCVDTDSLFERTSAEKTSAIVWGKDGRLIDFARFPIGPAGRLRLLRAIAE